MTGRGPAAIPLRVFVVGSTGSIGRACTTALLQRGHHVTCFIRPKADDPRRGLPEAAHLRFGEVTDPTSLARDGFCGQSFDAIVSCLASRTGSASSAWAIDYKAHGDVLGAGRPAGVSHMVLLSAICVQKPLLAFQQAKLAFERDLVASGLSYSIVRPTAFFKSLSGQVKRLRDGKPFLLFGDGRLTACKPISDADLANYLVDCLEDESLKNRILPIGGPGAAITPRDQAEALFRLLGLEPRYRHVPVALMDAIIMSLGTLGHLSPRLREMAKLARIGRYYATESMLVLNASGNYDADATPSTGRDTLFDYYARMIRDEIPDDRGDHAFF